MIKERKCLLLLDKRMAVEMANGFIAYTDTGADPRISQGGGGLYTIVIPFNANAVEGERRPRASGASS